MIRNILVTLLISSTLLAENVTSTTTTFPGDETFVKVDEYGNHIYSQSVKIQTQNYKVENFWKKFSTSGDGQDSMTFSTISKSGTVQIAVESTSLCTLYPELDQNGCSGQKPFLINNEALKDSDNNALPSGSIITLQFSKDYDGTNILYDKDNNFSFYPLDVDRDEEYYKYDEGDDSCHSFFCVMTGLFDNFFGTSFFAGFFDFDVTSTQGSNIDDVRERYITNITAGLDQNHLMEKNITTIDTSISGLNTHNPLSLIDYVENSSSTGSCNLGFFSFGSSSTFCNFMSGMPFISFFASQTPSQVYVIDTIQVDTENAIIAFAGDYANINVTEYETTVATNIETSSVLFPPLKIMCMILPFVSCDTTTIEEEKGRIKDSYYAFDESNATTLTMAVTNDGTKVDGFQTFKILGIHSIVGDRNVTTGGSCEKIQKSVKRCAMMGCVTTTSIIDSNPTPTTCDAYNPALITTESFMMASETTTIESIGYTDGSTTMNVSGRILSLDLKLVDINTSDKSTKLRYKLLSTD